MSVSWLASAPPDAAVGISPDRVSAAAIASRADGLVVTAHASEPLPPGAVVPSLVTSNIAEPAAVSAALKRVFERLGSRPRRVALVIPDSTARVSLVRFDRIPGRRDDFEQLVRWQVKKAAPFPIEEACVTYTPGARVDPDGREYLVVTARKDVIAGYEAACADAGAHAGLVDLATLSVLNMYLATASAPAGDWLLVHMSADSTSIAIMRGGDVIFYRNRAEGEQESLADLVHQTAMYYQDRLAGSGFARVLVGGAGRQAGIDTVRHSLEERLGVSVESVDPGRVATVADRISLTPELVDVLSPLVGILVRSLREGVAA